VTPKITHLSDLFKVVPRRVDFAVHLALSRAAHRAF
jgi:hypothetical protein